jgi:negative regulator of sigma E activity
MVVGTEAVMVYVRVVEGAAAQMGLLTSVLRSTVTVGAAVLVTVVVTVLEVSQSVSPVAAFVAVTSTLKLVGQPEPLWHVTLNAPVVESTSPAEETNTRRRSTTCVLVVSLCERSVVWS